VLFFFSFGSYTMSLWFFFFWSFLWLSLTVCLTEPCLEFSVLPRRPCQGPRFFYGSDAFSPLLLFSPLRGRWPASPPCRLLCPFFLRPPIALAPGLVNAEVRCGCFPTRPAVPIAQVTDMSPTPYPVGVLSLHFGTFDLVLSAFRSSFFNTLRAVLVGDLCFPPW